MSMNRDPEGVETAHLRDYVPAGLRVLEIGSGEGRLVRRYAGHARRVLGVDPDGERLATAARDTAPALRPRVSFACAQAEALPFPPGAFDAAVLGWSL